MSLSAWKSPRGVASVQQNAGNRGQFSEGECFKKRNHTLSSKGGNHRLFVVDCSSHRFFPPPAFWDTRRACSQLPFRSQHTTQSRIAPTRYPARRVSVIQNLLAICKVQGTSETRSTHAHWKVHPELGDERAASSARADGSSLVQLRARCRKWSLKGRRHGTVPPTEGPCISACRDVPRVSDSRTASLHWAADRRSHCSRRCQ